MSTKIKKSDERKFHVGAKAFIKDADGKVLLLKRPNGYWEFPGGRMKEGATIEETLLREIEEEIGITNLAIGELLSTELSEHRFMVDGEDFGVVYFIFSASIENGAQITLSREHIEFEWVEPALASSRINYKSVKPHLK